VRVAARAGREPDRDHETTAPELDPMPGPGGEHLPVVFGAKVVEGARDLHRRRPCHAVVIAARVIAAGVFEAEEEVYCTVAVWDGDRIVVGYVLGIPELLRQRDGVLLLRARYPRHV